MIEAWECTETGASTTHCIVTASSSIPVSAYTGPTYQEWLFVAGILIFILSFNLWREIFGWIPKLGKIK